MTNWSQLTHAYGSAEDIPGLLDLLTSDPNPERWQELWGSLCHQGSVYPASLAAIPWLTETASSSDREQAVNALILAGSIVARADEVEEPGLPPRERYATEIATLLSAVTVHLRSTSDDTEYTYFLEALLGFEGVDGWSEGLAWGLVGEEYQIACPNCDDDLFIALGEHKFCTAEDYALTEAQVDSRPLLPTAPADLHGIGLRLHDTARADGHPQIAETLTYVFGTSTCPACEQAFDVAEQIGS